MIKNNRLLFAWIISILATLGSLYFSEIRHFIPCEWCWFQRILMYPLSVILGIAYFKRDENIFLYIRPLVILGMGISSLHYMQQKLHIFGDFCTSIVPCSTIYINWLGFVTIPFLALIAFTSITFLSLVKK